MVVCMPLHGQPVQLLLTICSPRAGTRQEKLQRPSGRHFVHTASLSIRGKFKIPEANSDHYCSIYSMSEKFIVLYSL